MFGYRTTPEEDEVPTKKESIYKKDVSVVYPVIEQNLSELDEEESWTRYKLCVTVTTWLMVIAGIFLILISRAETDAFQSQPKILALFIVGIICEVPLLFWCKVMCFPPPEERERRRVIRRRRKKRQQLEDLNSFDDVIKRHADIEKNIEPASPQPVINKQVSMPSISQKSNMGKKEVIRASMSQDMRKVSDLTTPTFKRSTRNF